MDCKVCHTSRLVQKISQQAAQHRLMGNHQNVLLTFQFHDDGFQSRHEILVRFTSRVAVMKLGQVTRTELFGIFGLDFFVRHLLADALKYEQRPSQCRLD